MPRVVHFEIHAENPERAIEFYSGLFGWEVMKWEGPHGGRASKRRGVPRQEPGKEPGNERMGNMRVM